MDLNGLFSMMGGADMSELSELGPEALAAALVERMMQGGGPPGMPGMPPFFMGGFGGARGYSDDDEEEEEEEEAVVEPYEEEASSTGSRTLPIDAELERATMEILRESDIHSTTVRQVMTKLQQRFGVPLEAKKPFVKRLCISYARQQMPQPPSGGSSGAGAGAGGGGGRRGGGATGGGAAGDAGGAGGKGDAARALDEAGFRELFARIHDRGAGVPDKVAALHRVLAALRPRATGNKPPRALLAAGGVALLCGLVTREWPAGGNLVASAAEVDVVAAVRFPAAAPSPAAAAGAAGKAGNKASVKAGTGAGAAAAPSFNSLPHHSMRRVAAGALAELCHWEEAVSAMWKCGVFEKLPRMLGDLAAQYRYGQPYGSHYGRGRATDQGQYILPRLVYVAAQAAALGGGAVQSFVGCRLLPEVLVHYPKVHPRKTTKARARRRLQHDTTGIAGSSSSTIATTNAADGLGGFPSTAPPGGSSTDTGSGSAPAAVAAVAPLLEGACSDPEVQFSDAEGYDEPYDWPAVAAPAEAGSALPVPPPGGALRRRRRKARKAVNAPGSGTGAAGGSSRGPTGAAGAGGSVAEAVQFPGVPLLEFADEDAPCPPGSKAPPPPDIKVGKNFGGLGRGARAHDPDPMPTAFVLLLSQVWDCLPRDVRRRHLEVGGALAAWQALPADPYQTDLYTRILQATMRGEYQTYAGEAFPGVAAADAGLREAAARLRLRGNEAFKSGDYAGALEAYTHAVALDWDEPAHRNNRCFALTKLGRLGEARAEALQAVECDPCLARSWVRLGGVYEALRQPQCAQLCYRQALQLQAPRGDPELSAKLREMEGQLAGEQPWSFKTLPRRNHGFSGGDKWRNFIKQHLTPEQFKSLKHETASTASEMQELMRAMGFPVPGDDPNAAPADREDEEDEETNPVAEAARASEAYQATAKLMPLWESACAVEDTRRAPRNPLCNWNLSWSDVNLREGSTGLVTYMITVVDSVRGEQRIGSRIVYGRPRLSALRNALFAAMGRPLMGEPARPGMVFLAHRAVPYLDQLRRVFEPLGVQLLAESRAEAEQSAALHCTHYMGYNQRDSYITEKTDAYGLPAHVAAAVPPPPPCPTRAMWPHMECAYYCQEEGEEAAAEYRLLLAELAAGSRGSGSSSGGGSRTGALGGGAGEQQQAPPTDAQLQEAVRALLAVSDVESVRAEDLLRALAARFGPAAAAEPRAAALVRQLLAEAETQHSIWRRQQQQQQQQQRAGRGGAGSGGAAGAAGRRPGGSRGIRVR